MKTLSEIIKLLEDTKKEHGDLEIRLYDRRGETLTDEIIEWGFISGPTRPYVYFSDPQE